MNFDTEMLVIVTTFIPLLNSIFLICVVLYIGVVNNRLNKLFQVNASNIIDASEAVFKRMDYIIRWQKLIARMINEDRAGLQEHDIKVNKLMEVAIRIEKAIPLERETPHQ